MYQWPRRRHGRLLRAGRAGHRRPVADRADGRRRLELRAGAWLDATINVLEGLLEYERSTGSNGAVTAARIRGEEYLLARRLLHRLSDDEIPQRRWLYVGFPNKWFYDVVRVLDYFRQARSEPDPRMDEALDIVESKRDAEGRWPLDHKYHERLLVDFGDEEGQPSRWITLRALRILRWAGRLDGAALQPTAASA